MQRKILGFQPDAEGDFVADLSCGHTQHVRHAPPLVERAWVLSESGRAGRIGAELDCGRCARREMPAGHAFHRSTPRFDERSLPKALLSRHATAPGVWGVIRVERGELEYAPRGEPAEVEVLRPGRPGIIAPEQLHWVRPCGAVLFQVEFWRAQEAPASEGSKGSR